MKRVYVAGPISANDPITLFGNEKKRNASWEDWRQYVPRRIFLSRT